MSSVFRDMEDRYASSEEHLLDVLKWLDLTLLIQVIKYDDKTVDPMQNMRGIVISKQEISEIFTLDADVSRDPEYGAIVDRRAELEERIARKAENSEKTGVFLALQYLTRAFGLSDFERKCVIICFAYAIETKYEKIYAFLQEDVTRKKPTVELVARLLCRDFYERADMLRYFSAYTPFCRLALAQDSLRGGDSLASLPLQLDHGIVSFLLGNRTLDARMARFAELCEREDSTIPEMDADVLAYAGQIKSRVEKFGETGGKTVFGVSGPQGSGKTRFVRMVCDFCSYSFLLVDLSKSPDDMPLDGLFLMVERQATLRRAVVCFVNLDALLDRADDVLKGRVFAQACAGLRVPAVFIESEKDYSYLFIYEDVFCLQKTFAVPQDLERAELFCRCARAYALKDNVDPAGFAAKYRFTAEQVERALAKAAQLADLRSEPDKSIGNEELAEACRTLSYSGLEQYGQRIVPRYALEDIVLPPDQLAQLKAIRDHINFRYTVYGKWGFGEKHSRGNGVHALFFGPSGTGKTMAAEILANELSLALFRIDLSLIVSKYIGETEKNLKAVFGEAESGNAILFFDEADALFGKRTEIKDSHDRHANLEVAYLLQQMEAYEGVTILATNLLNNVDEAFARRMSFYVEFPFPDEKSRRALWIKSFPPRMPMSGDVNLEFLARRFDLSGGNIKNVVLRAAFSAASDGSPVMMRHLIPAVKTELIKMNKPIMRTDFGEYSLLIDTPEAHHE